jgi:hypothetical protein
MKGKGAHGQKKKPHVISGYKVSGYTLNPTVRSTKPKTGGSTNSKGK